MKTKLIIFICCLAVIFLVMAIFLFSGSLGITTHAIQDSENVSIQDNESNCWELNDGRIVCKVGTIEIASGGLANISTEIKTPDFEQIKGTIKKINNQNGGGGGYGEGGCNSTCP